ncbi:hypothetical protein CF327_g1543 [Tilletia walkeri]|uniref:Extracellular membrane protein CFEM domain-containing protein n=1 Tax=Tilletia walkeri TaxID=117179 RepID=A0A8X7T852_9BASI|nr:hypothetical protein CF327_g1543 [Tilletia walkeri]KAE8271588.1 hypothetical protein A4X09_0g753 [Tilletia walkeri]
MLFKSAFVLAATASLAVATAVVNEPQPRLFGAPSKPTGTAPAGFGFSNKGCFDFFECLLAGDPQGVQCKNMQCITPVKGGATSTKSTSTKSTSTKPGSTPLPSGVPAGYYAVAGRKCFDSFDCLLGDFTDTAQKCVKGQCYSNKAK